MSKKENGVKIEGFYRQVLDNLADGVTVQDRDFNIIYQNKALIGIFGDCVGKKCYVMYEKKDEICEDCGIQHAFDTGVKGTVVRTPLVAGGFWENVCFPLCDEDGRITAGVEICRDISDRAQLEVAVKDRNVKLGQLNTEIKRQAVQLKKTLTALREAQDNLVNASHAAGMAEVATNVLHNVGNVLNSVTVATGLIEETIRKSEAKGLARAVELMEKHKDDLGTFMEKDTKGRLLPAYLRELADTIEEEHRTLQKRIVDVIGKIEQINTIISLQQTYARSGGMSEICILTDVVEDAISINEEGLKRHRVTLARDFDTLPPVSIDKQKTVQILVNLISNAKYAVSDPATSDRQVTVRVKIMGNNRAQIGVEDNGEGIPPENIDRIFGHGFTTRPEGHGFGLHSAANAARELGGTLTVRSDGVGRGARFLLEIPVKFLSQGV